MNRRSFLELCGLSGITATAGCLGDSKLHPLPPVEGKIRARRVLASDDETYRPLLWTDASRTRVGDARLQQLLDSRESANRTVPTKTHETIASDYADLQYQVRLRQRTETHLDDIERGDLVDYNTGRQNFNRVMVGDEVTFQLGATDRPNVQSFGEISRAGTVVETKTVESEDELNRRLVLAHDALETGSRRRTYRTTAEVAQSCEQGRQYQFEVGGDYGERVIGIVS